MPHLVAPSLDLETRFGARERNGQRRLRLTKQGREAAAFIWNKSIGSSASHDERRDQRAGVGQHSEDTSQMLDGGSCRSSRLFVGERLDCLAGPGLRAGQNMRGLVGQGEGESVAIGGSRRVISNQWPVIGGRKAESRNWGLSAEGKAQDWANWPLCHGFGQHTPTSAATQEEDFFAGCQIRRLRVDTFLPGINLSS
jgi:hypothetical protein